MDPATMTKLWDAAFPDCPPEAADLKYAFASRWVRIHSLPGSKRYPETEAERQQVLGRYSEVLAQLGVTPQSTVICVTQTFSARGKARLSDDPRGRWEWMSWDGSPENPPWPENEPLPDPYERLQELRNRAAHHEPIFDGIPVPGGQNAFHSSEYGTEPLNYLAGSHQTSPLITLATCRPTAAQSKTSVASTYKKTSICA
jgi:hypothetical protein